MASKKILVVDDEKLIRWSLKRLLEKEGYDVSLAETGNEALTLINNNSPDLLILDLMLPDLSGMEILEKLRSNKCTVPVLIISAVDTVNSAVKAMKLGASDYFSKPFNIYKLRTMTIGKKKQLEGLEGLPEKDEERVTRIGRTLRKYHLDELPQFLNVIKGNMSIVGPRPEMEVYIEQWEGEIPSYRLRLAVKPGITGWAQVWFGHTSTLKGYKNKFQYDLYYLSNLSLKLDLEIMVRTVFRILGYPKIKTRR